jgi:hypothetical protein
MLCCRTSWVGACGSEYLDTWGCGHADGAERARKNVERVSAAAAEGERETVRLLASVSCFCTCIGAPCLRHCGHGALIGRTTPRGRGEAGGADAGPAWRGARERAAGQPAGAGATVFLVRCRCLFSFVCPPCFAPNVPCVMHAEVGGWWSVGAMRTRCGSDVTMVRNRAAMAEGCQAAGRGAWDTGGAGRGGGGGGGGGGVRQGRAP